MEGFGAWDEMSERDGPFFLKNMWCGGWFG